MARKSNAVTLISFVLVLCSSANVSAQHFNSFQPQPSQQNTQFRFTGSEFPKFSAPAHSQSIFRPPQQTFQHQPAPAQSVQPPLANFQQPQQNFQQPQQNFQQPQQNFQQPQQNFQQPQHNFQQPQHNFQQTSFQPSNFQPQSSQFHVPQSNFQSAPQSSFQPDHNLVQNSIQQQQQNAAFQPAPQNQQFVTQPPTTPTVAHPSTTAAIFTTPSTTQGASVKPTQNTLLQQLRQRQQLLQQLDLSLARDQLETSTAKNKDNSVFLANGQKLQVLTVSPKSSTAKPAIQAIEAPSGLLDAVTQGVVPSGVNYEVIRQTHDGDLENVEGLPSSLPKKVTFVILEEQSDGSYKVQGVRKGAGIPEGADVAAEAAKAATSGEDDSKEIQSLIKKLQEGRLKLPTPGSTPAPRPSRTHTTPRIVTIPRVVSTPRSVTTARPVRTTAAPPSTSFKTPAFVSRETIASQSNQVNRQVPLPAASQLKKTSTTTSIAEILRSHGLRSMAVFLEQVGLDRALNESSPFTMFAPTDLAFRAFLLELGGVERAQAKFRASPRLLSGLLLHHTIPGPFQVSELQDEMTGVSLAGTQLRVNVYASTDSSFNAKQVVTINGGAIADRSSDINLPGGSLVHAVSRVLFPLPVGDLLTSLEADPSRRFTRFVNAIKDAGLEDVFRAPLPESQDDGRTYTVFAPTDEAISSAPVEIERLFERTSEFPERRAALRSLLQRHVALGTLFSDGVTYYQAASSLSSEHPLRLFHDNGVFKVNAARVITPDIPATNGAIHVVDALVLLATQTPEWWQQEQSAGPGSIM